MAIRTRKLANGKHVYDVTVKHKGKREYATCYTLAEARAVEIELKASHVQSKALQTQNRSCLRLLRL